MSSREKQIRHVKIERAKVAATLAGRQRGIANIEQKLAGSLLPGQRADFERRLAALRQWIPSHERRLADLDATLGELSAGND